MEKKKQKQKKKQKSENKADLTRSKKNKQYKINYTDKKLMWNDCLTYQFMYS